MAQDNTGKKQVSAVISEELWNKCVDKSFKETRNVKFSKIIPAALEAYVGE